MPISLIAILCALAGGTIALVLGLSITYVLAAYMVCGMAALALSVGIAYLLEVLPDER